MRCLHAPAHLALMAVTLWVTGAGFSRAQDAETLSEAQKRDFLLNAKVVKSRLESKGLTGTFRLTLSDGSVTHDASFQTIDEFIGALQNEAGKSQVNFKDSYKFNLAAFELAKLLGLGDMMPVTVERRWRGRTGSLSWWLPFVLDEEERQKKKIKAPDETAWAKQINRMYVFSQLVYDTDRNLGNILYAADWHVWMIDFSRAFRTYPDLQNPKVLIQCDRQLWDAVRHMEADDVKRVTKRWLNIIEIQGLMARRDKIVAHFEKLIAEKGERAVIYR